MFDALLEGLPVIVLVAATAALYWAGARVVRRRSRALLPAWRVASFQAGLAVVLVSLVGPIDSLADDRFSVHMVQHVLLQMVGAPLLALGAPVTVTVLSLSRNARKKIAVPLLRSRAARALLSPLFAFVAFAVVLWGTHYPAIYDAAARNQGIHDLEHLAYLVTALLLWSVILGFDFGPKRDDHPARLFVLLCMMAVSAILGLVLSSSGHPLYPYYVRAAREIHISPLDDQHFGGVIMWVTGMMVGVLASVPVLLSWLAEDERRTVQAQTRAESKASSIGG